jgi:hypothetical protein
MNVPLTKLDGRALGVPNKGNGKVKAATDSGTAHKKEATMRRGQDANMLIPLLPERVDESHTDGSDSKRSASSFFLLCTAPSHPFVPYDHLDYDHSQAPIKNSSHWHLSSVGLKIASDCFVLLLSRL